MANYFCRKNRTGIRLTYFDTYTPPFERFGDICMTYSDRCIE